MVPAMRRQRMAEKKPTVRRGRDARARRPAQARGGRNRATVSPQGLPSGGSAVGSPPCAGSSEPEPDRRVADDDPRQTPDLQHAFFLTMSSPFLVSLSLTFSPGGTFETPKANVIRLGAFTSAPSLSRTSRPGTNRVAGRTARLSRSSPAESGDALNDSTQSVICSAITEGA